MTRQKSAEKSTTEAATPSVETKPAAPKVQKADKPSIEVLVHSPGLEITGRRDEVNGSLTTIHLEVGPARARYPEAAYPGAEPETPEEVTPAAPTDDQPDSPATDPES